MTLRLPLRRRVQPQDLARTAPSSVDPPPRRAGRSAITGQFGDYVKTDVHRLYALFRSHEQSFAAPPPSSSPLASVPATFWLRSKPLITAPSSSGPKPPPNAQRTWKAR